MQVILKEDVHNLGKSGEVVKKYVGAPNFAELHQLIESLLNAS